MPRRHQKNRGDLVREVADKRLEVAARLREYQQHAREVADLGREVAAMQLEVQARVRLADAERRVRLADAERRVRLEARARDDVLRHVARVFLGCAAAAADQTRGGVHPSGTAEGVPARATGRQDGRVDPRQQQPLSLPELLQAVKALQEPPECE
jgi:hypothetical protein